MSTRCSIWYDPDCDGGKLHLYAEGEQMEASVMEVGHA